jgi:cytochrome c-type biogenesis protein CcmE
MTLTRRGRRAVIVGGVVAIAAAAAALALNALRSNVAFFYTPSQVLAGEAPRARTFRVGGLVKAGSLRRDGMTVDFVVTDLAHDLDVRYTGILPDLFREGKGAVAQGRLEGDAFVATEVLAKHDENYMPPEAQRALDLKGKTGGAGGGAGR